MNSPPPQTPVPISSASSRRLFQLGATAVVLTCVYLAYTSPLQDPVQIALGLAMLGLSALPALLWARDTRPHFPAFEIFMLTGINFYAIPMLGGQAEMFGFPPKAVTDAALAVLAFQLPAVVVFLAVRREPAENPLLIDSLLPEKVLFKTQAGLWLNVVYLCVSNFTDVISWNIAPILRAMFNGVGTVCAFIQARLWGEGRLDRTAKTMCGLSLFLQVALLFSGLYLINGISILALFLIAYVTTSRRVPLLFLALLLPLVAVLHNGKATMRDIYWRDNPSARPTLFQLPGFFEQWITLGLRPAAPSREPKTLTSNLLERAALFHMVCLTADRIPAFQPYLYGETYKDLPAQFVPRIIWPGKPSPHLSNARLALYLSLVDQDTAETVSIAFGFIAEAYANFGLLGVAALGCIMGWGFKTVTLLGLEAPQFSALGLFLILLTAWSFQAEMVMASWLTSLFQAAVVVVGVPVAWRTISHR
jgi:uncharacterized membrane protein YqaE (UPF0057 family)